jgi:putative flavoprotein involved in K+ transport
VRTGHEVTAVVRRGGTLLVRYRTAEGEGEIVAAEVVNATGIITWPKLPEGFDPAAARYRWLHSLDVRTADLESGRRLLVVGGGASAAEVLERWLVVRPADSHAFLSLRSRLRALPRTVLGIDGHYWGWLPEQAPAWILGPLAGKLHEPMLGRTVPNAVRDGIIEVVPPVSAFAGAAPGLADGRTIDPELVVFATGFRYAAPHLGSTVESEGEGRPRIRACRSVADPAVWLLGARFSRTFASPYIRGIARDAEYVARRIARRYHARAAPASID